MVRRRVLVPLCARGQDGGVAAPVPVQRQVEAVRPDPGQDAHHFDEEDLQLSDHQAEVARLGDHIRQPQQDHLLHLERLPTDSRELLQVHPPKCYQLSHVYVPQFADHQVLEHPLIY